MPQQEYRRIKVFIDATIHPQNGGSGFGAVMDDLDRWIIGVMAMLRVHSDVSIDSRGSGNIIGSHQTGYHNCYFVFWFPKCCDDDQWGGRNND